MKSVRKLFALVLAAAALVCVFGAFAVPASAHTSSAADVAKISWAKRLTPGQTNHTIAYWWSTGTNAVSSTYHARITAAVQKLMYPSNYANTAMTNPVILWRTTNNDDSKMDFYQKTDASSLSPRAATTLWKKSTFGNYYALQAYPALEPDFFDWVYGVITLNHSKLNSCTNAQKEATIIHEMMHVYGAKDISDDPQSIMHNIFDTRTAMLLTADANKLLVNKYS